MLNSAAWVRERYGDATLTRVIAACSPAVRERLATGNALHWHPVTELDEFLNALDRLVGRGDGKIAEAAGAAAARVNLGRMGVRVAFFLGRPEFLMRRVAGVWRQYNDAGEMRVLEFANGRMLTELAETRSPSWAFCASITGWLLEAALSAGLKGSTAAHVECRARAGARCLWSIRRASGDRVKADPRA